MMQRIRMALVVAAALGVAVPVAAQQPAQSIDDLLKRVQQGEVTEKRENREREQRFQQDKASQQKVLADAQAQRATLEQRSDALETQFEENELRVADLTEQFDKRLGSLKELFGVLQQVAGDTRAQFENSITSTQPSIRDGNDPDRVQFLADLAAKMGTASKLASIEEIERLWFEMLNEMQETGRVVSYRAPVILGDGQQTELDVTRVGVFNLITDGKYLQYTPETGNITELARQPQQVRFVKTTADLANADSGMVTFALDPTRGQILSLLIQEPDLRERIDQGGTVGYIIIALGAIGMLLAVWRWVALFITGTKVRAQLKKETPSADNPLGRVLKVADDNRGVDRETLELKLGEAIYKERPALDRALPFIKIISVVAPLLGLLGTVTGMIVTFQAITLFGTGDPKLMAGGISQALVTTVLGLVVAIPTVLLHTLVSGRSRSIQQVLQEQAAGIVAERDEQRSQA
ncbi:MAG: MotA/TolQ/ExbB proton channel family protein [Chromatiales bacterium]|jgi:biopolymer transport protein ExbB|nr:MotA/TolQ/ExbB proton channel family protein [Chromatiales bacterium]